MSIESPTVSVIILATNENKYLLETINSVQQQTFADFEILICHSGSSLYLAKWFSNQKDRRLRLLLKKDLDIIEVLNLGIQEVKGEYIAFLKADDLWHPNKLKKQVFYLEHYSAIGLVHSWLTVVDRETKPVGKIFKNELYGWVESEIVERNQIGFSSVIVRQHCLYMVGLFNPHLKTSSDWDMWIRLSRCYQFMAIAEPLVYYRQVQHKTRDSWLDAEKDFQAIIEKAYQDIPNKLLPLKARSYSYASLSLAWQVLHNQNSDPAIAYHYCRQALEHYPPISFSLEFLELSVAVATLHWLKSDRYLLLLSLIKIIRSWLQIALRKFQLSSYSLLNWMLQENIGRKERRAKSKG